MSNEKAAQPATEPIPLTTALASFDALWSPRIVPRVNDHDVRVAKVADEHVWHVHEDAHDAVPGHVDVTAGHALGT
ncbi:hypothetical protein [Streptomyces sp. SID14515]|uniref:hypothetical protein n=1 Tax=Streptomyces sp. SID14515 TaxID=2706074 RepID=UPI0013C886AA|nr:hypothetical protein [Streptomyces sp. SID14515]NEB37210.1 hypothetical protein [Streptomyces sp. SID14515]